MEVGKELGLFSTKFLVPFFNTTSFSKSPELSLFNFFSCFLQISSMIRPAFYFIAVSIFYPIPSLAPTPLRSNTFYYQLITWLNLVFMGLGPFLLLITLNVLILLKLREMSRESVTITGPSFGAALNDRSAKDEVRLCSPHT